MIVDPRGTASDPQAIEPLGGGGGDNQRREAAPPQILEPLGPGGGTLE